jgi:hypothetical protein
MGVEELKKPANVWCQHCEIGVGCKIHGEHPPTCKAFECLWLIDEHWPDSVKPDQSHVVMSATLDGERLVANVDATRPNAYKTGEMGRLLYKVSQAIDVVVVIGDKWQVLTTPDRMAGVEKLKEQFRLEKLALQGLIAIDCTELDKLP